MTTNNKYPTPGEFSHLHFGIYIDQLEAYTALYESHQRLEAQMKDILFQVPNYVALKAALAKQTALVERAKVILSQVTLNHYEYDDVIPQWLKDAEGGE